MADAQHLLVPMKVQALVIDNVVITQSGVLKNKDEKYVAKDGKWSPVLHNYRRLINALDPPGPKPFFGAEYGYLSERTDQLVFREKSPALPELKNRGVYLHWVMPSGLRHAYKPGSLDFPALPDQWLIVRFIRRGAELQTKAWFVDSSLVITPSPANQPANLLVPGGNPYKAACVGKVVALDEFVPAKPDAARTPITAIGNRETGSPTFTAFVAENRNILSWHDNLDLTETTRFPKDAAVSYQLLGWYREGNDEPLAAIYAQLADKSVRDALGWPSDSGSPQPADVLKALGWKVDSSSLPADLLKRRTIFHGMVAHINYWNPDTYRGSMLGYPGSPSVEGTLGDAPPSFEVGIGNNAEDALVSLVSSEFSGGKDKPNLWKALEAVVYRQPESLVGSWNTAPRDHAVHQSWFSTVEAGKVWSIRPRAGNESVFPADPVKTAAQTEIKPTPEQLASLKELNKLQTEADAFSRELSALQQDLYARWWRLCEKTRRDQSANPRAEEEACRVLAERVSSLLSLRAGVLEKLRPRPDALAKKLPDQLELRSDAAPRFWTPADPVIVLKNSGLRTKHEFPRPLPCRLPEQTVTAAKVVVANKTAPFSTAVGVEQIASAAQKHFAPHGEILKRLLEEASLVEQSLSDLVKRTLPPEGKFFDLTSWRRWTSQLVGDVTWDGNLNLPPSEEINLNDVSGSVVRPHRLAELWVQQPWSPLFLDWRITWYPNPETGQDFGAVWRMDKHDFEPVNKQLPSNKGFAMQGRSLLSPIDERILKEPVENLRALLKPQSDSENDGKPAFPAAVTEILDRYQNVWDETLHGLEKVGLMGQALTGFHQALLRRDITLPRVMPDPLRPWAANDLKHRDDAVKELLDDPKEAALAGERLAPPLPADSTLPFTMLRAGTFKLDELWLVDDFGQWADLLHGTTAGGAFGQVFHPRSRWFDNRFVVAMPPRVVQPMRLNFRFTAADNPQVESDSDPALSPICGWMFYNHLDRALVLCDRDGRLVGELLIIEEQGRYIVKWETQAGGVAAAEIRNSSLRSFAQALIETDLTSNPRLLELLKLIDRALARIRPASARRDAALFGRPLALVTATLGLELFGKAWTNPKDAAVVRPLGTGDQTLDKLRVRVNLGCSHNIEDGLVGYFKQNGYNQIVPAHLPEGISPSTYVADPKTAAVHAGFGEPEQLTLLMDPWGSVQAAAGLVPAKTITLAQAELDKTLAQMEASFRVGPVLLQADKLALPAPAGNKGRWNFCGPLTNDAGAPIVPSDPGYFSDQPVVATEGRLLLLNTKE